MGGNNMSQMNYYIDGNTVRELEEATPVRQPRRDRRELEEAKRRKNRRNAARRNKERAMSMSMGYVAFLTCCVIISGVFASVLVNAQAKTTQEINRVANLESKVADLKADNDAKYKKITTSVDLNYIKDYAMNKLGMSYATEEQVVYYSVDKENYMDQYSDIPEN